LHIDISKQQQAILLDKHNIYSIKEMRLDIIS